MNIKTQLWIGAGIASVAAALVGVVLSATFGRVHVRINQFRQMDEIVKSVFELKVITADDQHTGHARTRDQWQAKSDTLLRDLNRLVADTVEQQRITQRMINNLASLRESVTILRELSETHETDFNDAGMLASAQRRLTAKIDSMLLSMMADGYRLRETVYTDLMEWQQISTTILTVSVLTMVALIFCMAGIVNQTVIRPLLRLNRAMTIIGEGDLSLRTGMTTENEVGRLSRSFDAMLDRLNAVMASRDALDREVRQREQAETQLKQTLTVLEHSNQELEEFAYVASHDLQEPLRKVSAFSSLLLQECAEAVSVDGREYLDHIQGAVKRMQALINDLLLLSRITTRAKVFASVDLNAVLRDVLEDLESRLRESNGTVTVEPLPTLDADATQLRQLFQNLIANALKFQKKDEPPVVRVWVEMMDTDANRIVIGVEDHGIGFETRFAERIFGLFQRLHGRQQYEGTGIGLAVCRRIVERHGGAMTAEGRPGDGATFHVELPLRKTTPNEGGET